jgi:hypothetical protein
LIAQKWPPIFGGKYDVNQDFCERLRHAV